MLIVYSQIFFEMGFSEMPTNQYIESGFWVCSLFGLGLN